MKLLPSLRSRTWRMMSSALRVSAAMAAAALSWQCAYSQGLEDGQHGDFLFIV
jgi:hypothetical protein